MKFFQSSMYFAVISSLDTLGKAAIIVASQELSFSKLKNMFDSSYVGRYWQTWAFLVLVLEDA